MLKGEYSLLLPVGFTDYFDIVNVEEKEKEIIIFLEEKLVLKEQEESDQLESKGFLSGSSGAGFSTTGQTSVAKYPSTTLDK